MNFILAALAACVLLQGQTTEPRLMRQPSIHGDTIVFSYAGDLWVTHTQGGAARRLTTSPGIEEDPQISPDGRTVAFTGQYDGLKNIYTIPIEGGEPKRLTYDTRNICLGWTPDGKIAYGTGSGATSGRQGQLWLVDPAGGLPQPTKLYEVGSVSFFPDGKTIAYNRQMSFYFNWRRYRGGSQGKVSFYNFPENRYWELPSKREQSFFPLVAGRSVFYISDRSSGVMNLYRYDMDTKQDRQVTRYADADIRTPSTDGKSIAYERDGLLYVYDIASGVARKIDARILSEDLNARPYPRIVADEIAGLDISPSGVRVALEARGCLFTVPAKRGDVRNLTNLSGARARYPHWAPDGTSIAYVTDQTGNYEVYTQPQLGGTPTQVTFNTTGTIEGISWSPSGKYLQIQKSDHSLWILEMATGKPTKILTAKTLYSSDWSPDERWMAYTAREGLNPSRLYVYEVATGRTTEIDDGQYGDESTAFDLSGKYLYLVSSRTFHPTYGQFEYSLKVEKSQRIYVIPLARETPNPLTVQNDEEPEGAGSSPVAKPQPSGAKSDTMKPETKIDFDGIASRILPLPMPAGNYELAFAGNNAVFYSTFNPAGATEQTAGGGATISKFDMESRESSPILSGVSGGFAVNPARTKIAYQSAGSVFVIDIRAGNAGGAALPRPFPAGTVAAAGKVDTSGLEALIDPRAEWRQMYWEAWRIERDTFYDPTMRGLDWSAIGKHYEQYLKWVHSRSDLNYVLGLLIGELGASHAYVSGGDLGAAPRPIPVGRLGADFEAVGGSVRFARIYRGHNYDEDTRGPLAEPGMEIHEGDYLLAIDGAPVDARTNPSALLVGKVNKYVTLTVSATPSPTGSRKVRVRPVASEFNVRYVDFADTAAKRVAELSHGRIGYMHVRNTSEQGANDFIRGFYSQTNKDAMIVDERWNGGGNVQPWFVDTLARKTYAYAKPRDLPAGPMDAAIAGPKAMLINGYAGSGGDLFPYMFRLQGLGPLIGERTWGGSVAIANEPNLVDGGTVTAPRTPIVDPRTGEIIAENHGIDPDIVVDARPDLLAAGYDPQLEAAVKYLMDQLEKRPPKPIPQSTPTVSPLGKLGGR